MFLLKYFYRRTGYMGTFRIPQQIVHGASERDAVAGTSSNQTDSEVLILWLTHDILQETERQLGRCKFNHNSLE